MKKHPASAARIEILEARIAPAVIAEIGFAELPGTKGLKFDGLAGGDFANVVANAGDVNGDGFDDIIIGAPFADEGGTERGAVYVVFGGEGSSFTFPQLSNLGGANGFKIAGLADEDRLGWSVSRAGDVNGDGFGDIIICALLANEGGTDRGAAYVVFGKVSGFPAEVLLTSLVSPETGFKIPGIADNDALRSVASAGDVNGDGFDDILIGTINADEGGQDRGAAYLIYGKASSFGPIFSLSGLNGTNGTKIFGAADNDFLGNIVAGAGDINGDGFDDFMVSAVRANEGGNDRGVVYVIPGRNGTFGATFAAASITGGSFFKISGAADGDLLGLALDAAGDVNGDGYDDIIVGASQANSQRGAAYVVFGKQGNSFSNIAVTSLVGANGFTIPGVANGDTAGNSVSGIGDFNGDGYDDIVVGAPLADENGADSGGAYVVFGRATFAATVLPGGLDGTNGLTIPATPGARAGVFTGGGGDVNGDGFPDVIVGARDALGGASLRGSSGVIYGFGTADVTVAPGGKSATFTDWDGDLVTIKTTTGTLEASQFKLSSPNPLNGGAHLVYLDLRSGNFAGTNLTFIAKSGTSGGDGLVNVGTLDARGVPLGKVTVDGNLQQVDADGITALGVFSFGSLDGDDVDGAPLTSDITGPLGTLTVKTDWHEAHLNAENTGALKIGGSAFDPEINIFDRLGSFTVGGSLSGDGKGSFTLLANRAGAITVGGSIEGPALIIFPGPVGKVNVGGSWSGYFGAQSAGAVNVKGSLNSLEFQITGFQNPASATKALALKSLTVGGSVRDTAISGGRSFEPEVQFGPVLVKGQWIASTLSVGVLAGSDGLVATADDTLYAGGTGIVSRIASITILGAVSGTLDKGNDGFGFVAEEIGSLKIGKSIVPLQKGARNDTTTRFLGASGDVRVREVAV